jgi:hypothetical protein
MVSKKSKFERGGYQVVLAEELPNYTYAGWGLVEILNETESVLAHDQVLRPERAQNQNPSNQYTKSVLLNVHRYLIYRDEKSLLAEVTEKNKSLTKLLSESQEASTKKDSALASAQTLEKDVRKHLEFLAIELEKTKKQLEEETQKAATHERTVKRLATDFSRVWAAVGDIQMQKLLGPDAVIPIKPEGKSIFEQLMHAGDEGENFDDEHPNDPPF